MAADKPDLMTLADVLERLRGRIGRTNLIAHLQAFPVYGGGPTHRKNGRKILFTADDYARFIESLARPVEPPSVSSNAPPRRRSTSGAQSAGSAYSRALELTAPRPRPGAAEKDVKTQHARRPEKAR